MKGNKKKSDKAISGTIVKNFGALNEDETVILAEVKWGDNDPKIDIRRCWKKDGETKLGKGISLDKKEIKELKKLLNSTPELEEKQKVNFSEIFSQASEITEKRDAGYTTEDGFIKLTLKPGKKLR